MRADTLNPLVLAWVGDAVCHEYVRIRLVSECDAKVHDLERRSTHYVSACAQAVALNTLSATFTEMEQSIARRALNAHAGHIAKNATVGEYRKSTSLEAVIGWLKLSHNLERMNELLELMWKVCNEVNTNADN